MLSKILSVAMLAATLGPLPAFAVSIGEVRPPKNPPPASFSGIQFVDSRGCVYMRAGYGGVVKWVPRVDAMHSVLCGYQPTDTGGAAQVAQTAPNAIPMATVASTRAAPTYSAPAARLAPQPVATVIVAAAATPAVQSVVQTDIVAPMGYILVWDDGRLNPMRGPRTAAGEEAMNQIWTRTVPARLVPVTAAASGATTPSKVTYLAYDPQSTARVATANAATGRFVQVGSFGVPANAAKVEAQLRALGLPVEAGHVHVLHTVMVGPLAAGQVASALAAVHGAGFTDAYARD